MPKSSDLAQTSIEYLLLLGAAAVFTIVVTLLTRDIVFPTGQEVEFLGGNIATAMVSIEATRGVLPSGVIPSTASSPIPSSSVTPSASATASASPSPTASASPTGSATPTISVTPSTSASPSVTASVSPSPTPSPTVQACPNGISVCHTTIDTPGYYELCNDLDHFGAIDHCVNIISDDVELNCNGFRIFSNGGRWAAIGAFNVKNVNIHSCKIEQHDYALNFSSASGVTFQNSTVGWGSDTVLVDNSTNTVLYDNTFQMNRYILIRYPNNTQPTNNSIIQNDIKFAVSGGVTGPALLLERGRKNLVENNYLHTIGPGGTGPALLRLTESHANLIVRNIFEPDAHKAFHLVGSDYNVLDLNNITRGTSVMIVMNKLESSSYNKLRRTYVRTLSQIHTIFWLEADSNYNEIYENEFYNGGTSRTIAIWSGQHNNVHHNLLAAGGYIAMHISGAYNAIKSNTILNAYHIGISLYGREHMVEGNEIISTHRDSIKDNSVNTIIRDNIIDLNGEKAIAFVGNNGSIINNTILSSDGAGIYLDGFNATVLNNTIFPLAPQSGPAIYSLGSFNLFIKGNNIRSLIDGIKIDYTDNVTIENNTVITINDAHFNSGTGIAFGGFSVLGPHSHIIVKENRVTSGPWSTGITAFRAANSAIIGNVINSQGKGIVVTEASGGVQVYNMTVEDNTINVSPTECEMYVCGSSVPCGAICPATAASGNCYDLLIQGNIPNRCTYNP